MTTICTALEWLKHSKYSANIFKYINKANIITSSYSGKNKEIYIGVYVV